MIRLGKQPGYLQRPRPLDRHQLDDRRAHCACCSRLQPHRALQRALGQRGQRRLRWPRGQPPVFEVARLRAAASPTCSPTPPAARSAISRCCAPIPKRGSPRLFARETRFDHVFSSCNRNFRLAGHDGPLWCGECPKCHFVFLIFAPVMDKAAAARHLRPEPARQARATKRSFRELTGLAGQKPWECVGEILEAAACLYALTAPSRMGRMPQSFQALKRAICSTQYGSAAA